MIEPEPAVAAQIFGDRIELARQFTESLGLYGEERGLIGPLEPPRLWSRHILNSAIAAPLFSGRVGDVGSGAGLPGLVLAIARPDVEWVLIEPMERRVAWLTEQARELGPRQRRGCARTRRGLEVRTSAGCCDRPRCQRSAHACSPHCAARARWR